MTAVADHSEDSGNRNPALWKGWVMPGLVVVAALVAGTVILLLTKQNLELKAMLVSIQPQDAVSIWEPEGLVPEIEVIDHEGQIRALPDLVDEGALVGFFTTTCPYCAETLPIWIGLEREADKRGIPFLAVSLHDQERTRSFIETNSTPYDAWAVVSEEDSRQLGVRGVPLTALLRPGGHIANVWRGALAEEDVRVIETELARITAPSF